MLFPGINSMIQVTPKASGINAGTVPGVLRYSNSGTARVAPCSSMKSEPGIIKLDLLYIITGKPGRHTIHNYFIKVLGIKRGSVD